MDIHNLTQEEIELIKKYREEKEKSELKLKFKNHSENYWDGYYKINFKIENGKVKISTESRKDFPKGHEREGSFYSGSGYFDAPISREEIVKMKDFFEYYLETNK